MRRILDLSGAYPAQAAEDGLFRVRVDKGCLLVSHGAEEDPDEIRIPATEVAVLVLGHRLALTGAVLGHVTANGGVVLALDDRFRPSGVMLPVEGNRFHAERLRLQIERIAQVAPPLWQQIVRAKITLQAVVSRREDLAEFAARVAPGDPDNVEATVARSYWPALFGEGFTRSEDTDTNRLLNYGYAVLRSVVARAVCASGLLPALGLHHHGGRDTFALADDLMEPARPMVDRVVAGLARCELTKETKRLVAGVALTEVKSGRGTSKLIEAYEEVCQSLMAVLEGRESTLALPEIA